MPLLFGVCVSQTTVRETETRPGIDNTTPNPTNK
jgi:hypothetical protein